MGWRDTASEQAQGDLDGLLGEALQAAQQFLIEQGEFYPFALVVGVDGGRQLVGVEADSEHLQAAEVLREVFRVLLSEKETLRATAVATNMHRQEPATDAVQVTLEHREGAAISAWLPYRTPPAGRGSLVFGEVQAAPAERQLW